MASNKISPNKHNLVQDTLINGTKKLYFNDKGGEYISGNGDDLDVTVGRDLDITGGRDINLISTTRRMYFDSETTISLDSGVGVFNFYDAGDTNDAFLILYLNASISANMADWRCLNFKQRGKEHSIAKALELISKLKIITNKILISFLHVLLHILHRYEQKTLYQKSYEHTRRLQLPFLLR